MPGITESLIRTTGALVALVVSVAAVPASALILTTTGTWENAGPRNYPLVYGEGTNVLSWGPRTGLSTVDAVLQSSYSFTGQTLTDFALPLTAGASSGFVLGTVAHRAGLIGNRAITQADLMISVSLSGSTPLVVDLASTFYNDETPSRGPAGAAEGGFDTAPTSTLFSYEGAKYRLALVGLLAPDLERTVVAPQVGQGVGATLQAGRTALRRLITGEDRTSRRFVQAQITRVPEPGTLSLLGLGLLGIASVLRGWGRASA